MPEDSRNVAPLETTRSQSAAPLSWKNWHAEIDGATSVRTTEYSLFSDAWFIADAFGYGPYHIINTVARTSHVGGQYEWKPALVLRVDYHLAGGIPNMTAAAYEHYHGGLLQDEIAALVALILGARIVAGPDERDFETHGDPLGRPRSHSAAALPVLPLRQQAPQIPLLLGQRDLREIDLLRSFPTLPPDAATALVKSARSYQQALWLADVSPELAWLLFVSAIETAAGYWDAVELNATERLERSYGGLVQLLRDNGQDSLIEQVAQKLHKVIGATSKFISFCGQFKPEPPTDRPQYGRFDFDDPNYRDALGIIYKYRSKALHGGTPFPHPMCDPPGPHGAGRQVEERPTGLASSSRDATWMAEDLPMYLHLFAHITRGALLNWWKSLAEPAA